MKRIIALVIAAIISVSVLAGCGGGSDLNKVMSDINSTYSLNLKTLESKDDLSKYYSIKPESVKQFAAEIDSNNNAPVEIIMVEATDAIPTLPRSSTWLRTARLQRTAIMSALSLPITQPRFSRSIRTALNKKP